MLSHHLLSGLLKLSFQGALVVVVVLAVQALLGRWLKPRWRCLLWLLLFVRLLVPASVGARWSLFNAPGLRDWLREVRATEAPTAPIAVPPAQAEGNATADFGIPEDPPAIATLAPSPAIQIASPRPRAKSASAFSWRTLAVWIWAAGLAAFLAQVAIRAGRWRRDLRSASPVSDPVVLELVRQTAIELGIGKPPPIFENETVAAPVLHGIEHPRLMLPRGFAAQYSREEIRFIVFHELIHFKRHDLALNWLATLLQAIHWFNPLIWIGFSRLRLDRELACDAAVLEHLGAVRRRRYAETIIRLMEGHRLRPFVPGRVGAAEAPAHLRQRIAMISEFEAASRLSVLGLLLVACIGAVCLTDAPRRLNSAISGHFPANTVRPGGLAVPMLLRVGLHPLNVEGQQTAYESILGRRIYDGLPFDITGSEGVFGKFAEDRHTGNRRMAFSAPVGVAFAELHVIHAAVSSADPDGTPIAIIRLLYADGRHHDFTVSYGVQVRDRFHYADEPDESLADPNSKLIFRGPGDPYLPGSSLRLFKSMFRNPRPNIVVSAIKFISAGNQSCYEIVAATVADADPGRPITPPLPLQRPVLPLNASLRIRVMDKATGRTLMGSFVTVAFVEHIAWNATGLPVTADGPVTYRYASARRGEYEIDATCPGYVPAQREWSPGSASEITLALSPGLQLHGRVIDPAGNPVAGAAVVEGFADGSLWRSQKTASDASGAFSFEGLPKGRNLLVISAPGFAPMSQWIAMDGAMYAVERMSKGRVMAGRIVDMSGKGIAGASVQFSHGEGAGESRLISHTLRWAAKTDQNGRFQWDEAPQGPIYLNVIKNGYMSLQDAAYPEKSGIIALGPLLAVHGAVTDRVTGRPIADFQVKLGRQDPGGAPHWFPGVKAFDQSEGTYTFSFDQPPQFAAYYVFSVEAPGYRPFVSKPIDCRSGATVMEVSLTPVR